MHCFTSEVKIILWRAAWSYSKWYDKTAEQSTYIWQPCTSAMRYVVLVPCHTADNHCPSIKHSTHMINSENHTHTHTSSTASQPLYKIQFFHLFWTCICNFWLISISFVAFLLLFYCSHARPLPHSFPSQNKLHFNPHFSALTISLICIHQWWLMIDELTNLQYNT